MTTADDARAARPQWTALARLARSSGRPAVLEYRCATARSGSNLGCLLLAVHPLAEGGYLLHRPAERSHGARASAEGKRAPEFAIPLDDLEDLAGGSTLADLTACRHVSHVSRVLTVAAIRADLEAGRRRVIMGDTP